MFQQKTIKKKEEERERKRKKKEKEKEKRKRKREKENGRWKKEIKRRKKEKKSKNLQWLDLWWNRVIGSFFCSDSRTRLFDGSEQEQWEVGQNFSFSLVGFFKE